MVDKDAPFVAVLTITSNSIDDDSPVLTTNFNPAITDEFLTLPSTPSSYELLSDIMQWLIRSGRIRTVETGQKVVLDDQENFVIVDDAELEEKEYADNVVQLDLFRPESKPN